MKKNLIKIGAGLLAASPLLAFAQVGGQLTNIVSVAQNIVNSLVPLFMTLALVYFIWGLIKYIRAAGDAKAAAEGRSIMIWGVVALFVMASIWGLVGALQTIFGINTGTAPSSTNLTPR